MPLKAIEKIQVVMHEYDTLRSELISRHAAMFQSIGIGSAVLN
jgi:hypothetical protein